MQEFYNEARELTKDTLTLLREVETAHTKLDAVGTIATKTKAVIDETYNAQKITEAISSVSNEMTRSKIQTSQGLNLVKDVHETVKDHNERVSELSAAIENNLVTVKNNHQILEQTMAEGAAKTDENLDSLNNSTTNLHNSVKEWIHNPIFSELESTKAELSNAVIEIGNHQNEQMERLNTGYHVLEGVVQNLEQEITKYRVTNSSVLQTVNLLNRLADGIDNKIESASPTIGIKTAEELENVFEQNSSDVSLEDLVKKLETTITPTKEPLRVFADEHESQPVNTLDYTSQPDDTFSIKTNIENEMTDVKAEDDEVNVKAVEDVNVDNVEDLMTKDIKDVKVDDVEEVNENNVEDVKVEDVEEVKTEKVENVQVDAIENVKIEGVENIDNTEPSVEIEEQIKVEFPEPTTVEPVKEEKHGFFSKFFGMKG